MNLIPEKITNSTKVTLLLLILLGLDLFAGIWFFRAQQQQQARLVENQLTAIGNLKIKEIEDWRQRMVDEATLLTESPFFAKGVELYMQAPQVENAQALLNRIRSITTHYHYPGVMVLNPRGETVVSYGPFTTLSKNGNLVDLVKHAVQERRAELSDLYRDEHVDGIYLAIATPLFRDGQDFQDVIGSIVLICDPGRYLFPLVGNWPIPSETAESLLVRADGEDVLYLNELRHRPDSALHLRQPLTSPRLVAAAAVSGKTGTVHGIDYRGEQVTTSAGPIAHSPWFLLSKIDDREAFALWRSQSLLLILTFAGIAALLIALGLVIRQRSKQNYYRRLLSTEQQLRQNAERSTVILRGIADGVIVTDKLGHIELLNPAAEGLTGWDHGEAIGKALTEVFTLIDGKSGDVLENPVTKVLRHGEKVSFDHRPILVDKNGRRIPIADSGAPLHDSLGNITGAVLVFRDQSKAHFMERLAEARLRISLYANNHSLDDLLTTMLDEICELVDSPIGFFHFVDDDQKTLHLQQWSTKTLRDFCRAEGKGLHYDLALAGVWADCLRRRQAVIHNDYASLPHKQGLPAGHAPVIRELVVPVLYNDKVVAILGVGNKASDYDSGDVETISYLAEVGYHVIAAKKVEEELRASLRTSDDLVRAIPSGLFIYQYQPPDGLVLVSGNPAAARFTGKEMRDLIGKNFDAIWPAAKAEGITDRFLEVMQSGRMYETEDLQYKDEQLVGAFRIRAFALPGSRLAVAFEDISKLKSSEAEKEKIGSQLQQAQKMESVGRLAGGVAHDFNNMLSVIIGNAEMALEHAENHPDMRRELEEIKKAALRSADLTRQLLAFARKQAVTPRVINLNHSIEGMLRMLRRLIGEDIQLAWLPETALAPIFIDPSQVDQILANLCVNARDAINGVGKITIETGTVSLNAEYCLENPGFIPGDYTLLSVSDNGSGIAKEHLKVIFEPFFTTKKQGEGTGLGLAMIYGIVKQNGGFIKVYSEATQGTTFRIYLPQYLEETEDIKREEEIIIPKGHGQLVLLVEDETVVLDLNVRMLERLGYKVLATSSATEALHLALEHREELQVLLTDMVMPEMNGHDLAKSILRDNPDLKCLFVSGYTANVIARQGFLPEGINFLQKPFMKKDLAVKLHQILAA